MGERKGHSQVYKYRFNGFSAPCWESKHKSSKHASGIRLLARARLLRARRSHSAGSMGEGGLCGIDHFALPQCRVNDQPGAVAILVNFLLGKDEDIYGFIP